MGMGRKKDREKQQGLWVAASEIVTTPGHVFYERLNTVLNAEKFDQRVEAICRKYYKSSSGRPSITPGTYFRMLLLGYFEGIDSERGIAWSAADSLSFRKLSPEVSQGARQRARGPQSGHESFTKQRSQQGDQPALLVFSATC